MNETTVDIVAAPVDPTEQALDKAVSGGGFTFGRFSLYPMRHILLEGEKSIRLGGRAAAILAMLVERAGEIVSKEDIIRSVWPSTHVAEGNLRVQIASLRKILNDGRDGEDIITSVVGRGYRFVAPVERIGGSVTNGISAPNAASKKTGGPAAPLSKVFGRGEAIRDIRELVGRHRLVTIVGPGGIGKTTVAVAATQQYSHEYQDGMYFVDLATVANESTVPFAVASTLNLSVEAHDPTASLIAFLSERNVFLLLDNCEHVINAVADLAEALLKNSPRLRILATSHEPLRAEGEWLFRLSPLALPSDDETSIQSAVLYPSIELFVDRATSDNQGLVLNDSDVPLIVEICRKLDGIPLAIEIAAASVEVFGIAGLADRLEDRLDVLKSGRRTAVQRHQTIRDMLDWSHEALTQAERVVLRRLAIFAGAFSMEAATMIAGDESLGSLLVTESLSTLVRKSLLNPNAAARPVTYRLLDSTRIYAFEKLEKANEVDRMRRLHMQFVIEMLMRAETEWKDVPQRAWLERYGVLLDDIRNALSWAFSSTGDASAGVRLTALALPLGIQQGFIDEFRRHNDVAIARARDLPVPELLAEMRLNLFHGFLNTNQTQPVDGTIVGVRRAAELAELIDDDRCRLQPMFMLAGFNMGMGNYVTALAYAEDVGTLAYKLGDELAILGSQRILAQTSHFNGLHERTTHLAKTVLAHPVANIPFALGGIQIDRRVSMRIMLSRSLWMLGKADQAAAVMMEAVDCARDYGPAALCQTLSQAACPILMWRGEADLAEEHVDRLLSESSRYTLRHWHSWGLMYSKVLSRGSSYNGEDHLETEGDLQVHTLGTISRQASGINFTSPTLVAETGWAAAELLRLYGEQVAATDAVAARMIFSQAMDVARAQGALAWELRIATSAARLDQSSGLVSQAAQELAKVHSKFSEGFDTADFRSAASLLNDLSAA